VSSAIQTVLDLFVTVEFIGGLITGGAALLFCLVVGFGRGGPGWGIAVAAATFAAVYATFGRRLGLIAGLLILLAGGWLLERSLRDDARNDLPLAWALILGGAVLSTIRGGLDGSSWIQLATPAYMIAFGYSLGAWRHMSHHHALGPLFAITAFGIWATVPETSTARILLGVAVVLAVATMRRIDLRISTAGAFVVAATVAWVGAEGGAARPGAIIGAWGAAGLLLVLPWFGQAESYSPRWLVVGLHTTVVLLSSRVFGLWESAPTAAVGVVAALLVAYAVLFVLLPMRDERRQMMSGP